MSVVLQALSLFIAQSSSPFDRAESLLQRTDGFTASVSVSATGRGSANGTYSVRRPSLQRFELKGDQVDEVFIEGKQATVQIDNLEKEYTWYPAFKFAIEAPEEASILLRLSLPLILTQNSFTKLGPRSKWVTMGTESVDGHPCDIVTLLAGEAPSFNDQSRIWVDPSGRVLRIRTATDSPSGKIIVLADFKNPTYEAPPESAFEVKIPWGYTPSKFEEPRVVKYTGEKAEFGKWTRVPSMEQVAMSSKDPILVVVSSDDLVPEADAKRWKGLAELAKKAKIRFAQMWVGKKPASPSTEWDSYWDKDGTFEASFGPPMTPYLMLFCDQALISAWQGWSEGDDEDAARTLFSPLSRRTSH